MEYLEVVGRNILKRNIKEITWKVWTQDKDQWWVSLTLTKLRVFEYSAT